MVLSELCSFCSRRHLFYFRSALKNMYSIAVISNPPRIIFAVSSSFENESRLSEVIPVVMPIVESAKTDSNMPSSKLLPVGWLRAAPVAIDTKM
jgi:hypothetical protein